ncbi:uncharacterized protein LOC127160130 [Labeo rohita]|uniref:uncharacterized protein LOC127160130 n=1 Tax=Labeo rohita TaxID=84645 RepID=UPI0021E2934E|nr:uncharacterized protein LOC127160130 [Labeo rohita]
MADKCLLGLIILCPLLTGMNGAELTHVFCSSGENVHLPCNNALSDCTSTTWNYNRYSSAVELVSGEKKKNGIERHERLSVGSDCSLNIKKVTEEDYGSYSCRQYVNGQQQGTDARVYLHFLHVSTPTLSFSSSSSQTEIRPGSSVTLSCQLYYDGVSCDTLVRTEGIHLIWVNQAGVNLQTDSRYQISFSSTHCNSTLTTTLLNEDHNREWRCQVIQRNEQKTSVTYTVKYPATTQIPVTTPNSLYRVMVIIVEIAAFAAPTVILLQIICARRAVSSSNSEKKSTQTTTAAPTKQKKLNSWTTQTPKMTSAAHSAVNTTQQVIGIVVAAVIAVLLPAVILCVICKKKADNRRGTNGSVVSIINQRSVRMFHKLKNVHSY